MKRHEWPILGFVVVGILATVLLAACGQPAGHDEAASETAAKEVAGGAPAEASMDNPCLDPPPCGDDCSNYPYEPTDCWTTTYGPAKADIVVGDPLKSTNMLYCEGGTYALCFFSGPPYATGRPEHKDSNPLLPCVLGPDGTVANCTCEAFTTGPYFVDINGILNLGAYYETVTACETDGSGCANIVNCGKDGSVEGCDSVQRAPVCDYVANQNPDDPMVSLIPGADLISTFSFAMDDDYELGSTPDCDTLYAGCMTAPCTYDGEGSPSDGDLVQCACPTYNGSFQVGQFHQECTPTSEDPAVTYVWSASNTVNGGGDAGAADSAGAGE